MAIYQDEFIKKENEKYKLIDYSSWLSGSYIVNAIQTALNPKKVKYISKPQSECKKQEPISESEKFKLWVAAFNKKMDKS